MYAPAWHNRNVLSAAARMKLPVLLRRTAAVSDGSPAEQAQICWSNTAHSIGELA
jgi:hypothetical protein